MDELVAAIWFRCHCSGLRLTYFDWVDFDLPDDCPDDPMDVDWDDSDLSDYSPDDPMEFDWVDSDLFLRRGYDLNSMML